ncbi:glycosyltransferase family 2 protein [Actinoplanes sp. GCM10030250]|uniref:glycosyltransferase family 2 protein n=1 Tax=Actinoplanes sp. GCM10030250 TaxID=3273376 RepID=UPI003612101C
MSEQHPHPETVVLLPVYRPGKALHDLVTELLAEGFEAARTIIVDDGSGPDAESELAVMRLLGCTVLQHPSNQGKGIALKTGFRYAVTAHPGLDVVCADPDGQHHATDIRRVAERAGQGHIVLGVRAFDGMPARSRFGNTITRALFRAATGRGVSDTQTGLRVYPSALLERLCAVPGERFEYEMNVLLEAARTGHRIEEVRIPTIYVDGNSSSHFGSVADSVRIYRPLLQYAATSLLSRRAA